MAKLLGSYEVAKILTDELLARLPKGRHQKYRHADGHSAIVPTGCKEIPRGNLASIIRHRGCPRNSSPSRHEVAAASISKNTPLGKRSLLSKSYSSLFWCNDDDDTQDDLDEGKLSTVVRTMPMTRCFGLLRREKWKQVG